MLNRVTTVDSKLVHLTCLNNKINDTVKKNPHWLISPLHIYFIFLALKRVKRSQDVEYQAHFSLMHTTACNPLCCQSYLYIFTAGTVTLFNVFIGTFVLILYKTTKQRDNSYI